MIMKKTVLIKNEKMLCDNASRVLKSLSHPQRLLILVHLLNKSKTVTELVDLCKISQSQTSQFLTRMKLEGLISSKKDGKSNLYSIVDKKLIKLINTIQTEYCSENQK